MNNALKFLLLAAGCAVVVLLITIGVKTANKGKEDTNGNLDQYSKLAGEYEDIELKVYDNAVVLGSEIKQLIKDNQKNNYLSIKVRNGKNNDEDYLYSSTITDNVVTIGNQVNTAVSTTPSSANYINDAGKFLCKVFYDKNGVVACLQFQQQP